jgi:hypothetical protein
MTAPRFLVAKYVPDLRRQEPRNIGVIAWSAGQVAFRFLEQPAFVKDRRAYRDWIDFWTSKLAQPGVSDRLRREAIPKSSPDYLDAFKTTARENYVLVNGGRLLDPVATGELGSLVDDLFQRVVEDRPPEEKKDHERRTTLARACKSLVEDAGLKGNPHFKADHEIVCPIGASGAVTELFCFTYAYWSVAAKRLYQRVHLPDQLTRLLQSRHHAAWMFKNMVDKRFVEKDDCAAIVNVTEAEENAPDVAESLAVLSSVGRVVNVHHYKTALKEFKGLKKLHVGNGAG